MDKAPTVLLSAYACEPNRGSEPEVGWRSALELSKYCRVSVLTRANNQGVIEEGLAQYDGPKPEFFYYDLPGWCIWWKKKFGLVMLYYALWQWCVRRKFQSVAEEHDLVHHVTFNGFQLPGFWGGGKEKVILGPLGGGMVCPEQYLPLFGAAERSERIRSFLVRMVSMFPWWRKTIRNAVGVFSANEETRERLQLHASVEVTNLLETGIAEDQIEAHSKELPAAGEPIQVLWLGNLMARKSPLLAVMALAEALKKGANVELVIAGEGPERMRVEQYIREKKLEEKCRLVGRVPKEEVLKLMERSDAFLFSSLRDTSGNVVLEAMSRGIPILTIRHQGVAEMCDDSCAILVEPGSIEETVEGLGDGLYRLDQDRELIYKLGKGGGERLRNHFTWKRYGEQVSRIYTEVLEERI